MPRLASPARPESLEREINLLREMIARFAALRAQSPPGETALELLDQLDSFSRSCVRLAALLREQQRLAAAQSGEDASLSAARALRGLRKDLAGGRWTQPPLFVTEVTDGSQDEPQ